MRILSVTAKNFGSYKELGCQFENKGLTLISGPTGAGKSTLCDLTPWVLFGRTSKNGVVDEIRSWGTEVTEGTITLDHPEIVSITRIRTAKSTDLYYETTSLGRQRGKDTTDTQNQINTLLGFDIELYLSGSYLHEFSQTAQFFTTTAKNRRAITEQLVDLSLATRLAENSTKYKKELKIEVDQLLLSLGSTNALLLSKQEELSRLTSKASNWEVETSKKITILQQKHDDFTSIQNKVVGKISSLIRTNVFELNILNTKTYDLDYYTNQINTLDNAITKLDEELCPTCGSSKHNTKKVLLVRDRQKLNEELQVLKAEQKHDIFNQNQITKTITGLQEQLTLEKNRQNNYLDQLKELKTETNPYDSDLVQSQITVLNKTSSSLKSDINEFKTELSDLDLLGDVLSDFRGLLVKNTIKDLEINTNKLLTNHFDAEIQVRFDLDSDKLEVEILKDGNLASFTQLSKGQRCLLKLCFGVSVMEAVANHHSVDFTSLFFDETLDGLSEPLKEKAFGLFSLLETKYENIFVVDHSESLKSCFNNRINVSLIDGGSQIE